MHTIIIASLLNFIALVSTSMNANELLIQVKFKNYEGDKAYSVLYLINPNGRYEQTLWVSGDDPEWQEEGLPRWWKYQSRKPKNIDGITGASVGSGDRYRVKAILSSDLIDQGYKLRVATSVEELPFYSKDVEIDLSTENIGKKHKGTGYINYIRYKW